MSLRGQSVYNIVASEHAERGLFSRRQFLLAFLDIDLAQAPFVHVGQLVLPALSPQGWEPGLFYNRLVHDDKRGNTHCLNPSLTLSHAALGWSEASSSS